MGLLSGLERFGLGNLENMEVYEAAEKAESKKAEASAGKVVREEDFLFDKSRSCPVCGREFKALTVKAGKAKLSGSDQDLRPRYEQLDILKYDVIMCPKCGYTALSRFFAAVTQQQAKNIINMISRNFTSQEEAKETYTYDEALERYRMALANAIVKRVKSSEKAYICLKAAWLLRGKAEHLDESLPDYEAEKKKCNEEETAFLQKAMEGFQEARKSEIFPICGMDQHTVDYLIAALALRFGDYNLAGRLVTGILQSGANVRVKNKARDLKEVLLQEMKKESASSE